MLKTSEETYRQPFFFICMDVDFMINTSDNATVKLFKSAAKPCIHPAAIVSPKAQIAPGVTIGPYAIIGDEVSIGEGTSIAAHVTIEGCTAIGARNQIATGAIIGAIPQDLKFKGEYSSVCVGNNNIIREYVTINRGTSGGGGQTIIGDHNVILTAAHVGHDVVIGQHNVISNNVQLGGHVVIDDWVTIGALSGIHQFVKIGQMAMIGALSLLTKDVTPFALVAGNPAKRFGINIERLRRNEISSETRLDIQRAYKILFHRGHTLEQALLKIEEELPLTTELQSLINFLRQSTRGIYR